MFFLTTLIQIIHILVVFLKSTLGIKTIFRYSMYVNLRLTEYFWSKYKVSKFYIFKFIADYFRNKNVRDNSFEHGYYHNIQK